MRHFNMESLLGNLFANAFSHSGKVYSSHGQKKKSYDVQPIFLQVIESEVEKSPVLEVGERADYWIFFLRRW